MTCQKSVHNRADAKSALSSTFMGKSTKTHKEGYMENYEYLLPQGIADEPRYPITINQVRHFLLMRHKNGLEKAVRKIGKRLYIRKDLFEQWIESYRGEIK
jgi:hypothetical protein